MDPTPVSDIFEEEFDFELMRDAMERRLKLALGIDDDSSSKVSGRKDLKEAILGKLSLDKIRSESVVELWAWFHLLFLEEQIQRMVFRCLSWNPKTHLKNVTKHVDYLHGAFENRKNPDGTCTGCVSKTCSYDHIKWRH